jgi:hypothetical protein
LISSTIFGPLYQLWSSLFHLGRQRPPSCVGPYILRKIFLSNALSICLLFVSLSYPACNAHASCHLWPAQPYSIFPHCLIRHVFRKKSNWTENLWFFFYNFRLKYFSF